MLQGIVVAAGLSSRMADFKPLLPLGGHTLIEHTISGMFGADVEQVVVVLGYRGADVEAVLRKNPFFDKLSLVHNPEYANTQMMDSIKIGIQALNAECSDFFLLPGDIPAISLDTFRAVRTAHQRSGKLVTFPAIQGHPKHPPLISVRCIERILSFQENGGLRQLWKTMSDEIEYVPVCDLGCTLDVDVPKDYETVMQYLKGGTVSEASAKIIH